MAHITLAKWSGSRVRQVVENCSSEVWNRLTNAALPVLLSFNLVLVTLQTSLDPLAPDSPLAGATQISFKDYSLAHQYLDFLRDYVIDYLKVEPLPRNRFHVTIDRAWELTKSDRAHGLDPMTAVRCTFDREFPGALDVPRIRF